MNKNELFSAFFITVFIGLVILIAAYKVNNIPLSSPSSLVGGVVSNTLAAPSALMNVSAYCPCEKCCGSFADGVTASGAPAEGFLVAAPPNIPFGTLLSIPGYAGGRPVEVKDRGGAIKGNKLDLLFPTHQAALNFGRQELMVTFN